MDYTTLAALKSALGIDADDTRRDTELGAAVTAASRDIDNYCHTRVGFAPVGTVEDPVSRTFDSTGGLLVIDELVSLSSIAYETGGAIDADTVVLLPRNAEADGRPYLMIRTKSGIAFADAITITGVWGWAVTPEAITEATLIQASAIASAASTRGDGGGDPMLGGTPAPSTLHPTARHLAGPYQRAGIG